MKQLIQPQRFVFLLAITAATIGFTAFRQTDSTRQKSFRDGYTQGGKDTTRNKRDRSKDGLFLSELEQSMKSLEVQMKDLEKQLKTIDLGRVQTQVNEQMKKVDLEKINKEMALAMKEVDMEKIHAEVSKATSELKKLDSEKFKKKMEKVQTELQEHRKDWQIDHEKISRNLEQEMKKVNGKLAELNESMQQLTALTEALHKDKLIDKNKPYTIEVKTGDLYINGVKQSQEISDKYRSFYQEKSFSIKNDGDNQGIRI